jgi:hypothetical protein
LPERAIKEPRCSRWAIVIDHEGLLVERGRNVNKESFPDPSAPVTQSAIIRSVANEPAATAAYLNKAENRSTHLRGN